MDASTSLQNGGVSSSTVAPPSYAEAFPPLLINGDNSNMSSPSTSMESSINKWMQAPLQHQQSIAKITPIKQSVTTQMFEIAYEERRFKDITGSEFGANEQNRHCIQVQNDFDVHIELHNTHSKGLTVLVTGRLDNVAKAAAELRRRIQTQSSMELQIPQQYHRFICGKNHATLSKLKETSGCDIQMPGKNAAHPDLIRIVGPKENLDKARHDIHCIYDEMSRKATEVLDIPKDYHPFISGPNNSVADALMRELGTRINIPPWFAQHDVTKIRVSGEKEGVAETCRRIRQIYEDAKQRTHTISIEIPKVRHRYVFGPKGIGVAEILTNTGVSVEIPHSEDASESIVLRGESAKLGLALTMVYEKAESIATFTVIAPAWSHRSIIGQGRENLRLLTEGHEKVVVHFLRSEDKILIEGPKVEAEMVHKKVRQYVEEFLRNNTMVEIPVLAKYHRNVIGKGGEKIRKIREDTGCTVHVPGTGADAEDVIRIEGPSKKVEIAKKELQELVAKLENEKVKDLIIERRFHSALIGQKGARIAEIRDKYPEVMVKFPDPKEESDVVQLRGPRDSVAEVEKWMKKSYKDLKDVSFESKVKIFKEYHKDVIGKRGQTIGKIREETNTRIILPESKSSSDVITVVGREKDVLKAVRMIEEVQNKVAQISEEVVTISPDVHQSIIGPGGAIIRHFQDEHHVHIHFPSPGQNSDRVTVRGNKSVVKNAVKALQKLAKEQQENNHHDTVSAKTEYHRFLIGRQGSNIDQMRKETGARILFPDPNSADKEGKDVITVVGTKEAVANAKKLLEQRVRALEDTVEETMEVDKKWHREFVDRRFYYVNKISNDCGGVRITFPKDATSSQVVLKGPKDCVRDAIAQIRQIVEDMATRITVEVNIPAKHHPSLIGRKGNNVRDVCDKFDVKVNFPGVNTNTNGNGYSNGNGVDENGAISSDGSCSETSTTSNSDVVTIIGKPEACETAKEALLALIPVTESIDFPVEFHGSLIGRGGGSIQSLSSEHDVHILVPKTEQGEDKIFVTGLAPAVKTVKEELLLRLAKFEEEKSDRVARNYQSEAEIPYEYHRQIVGPKWTRLNELQSKHEVRIVMPKEQSDIVRIIGYKAKTDACKDELEQMVEKIKNQTTAELVVVNRVHPMIIGQRGRNLRELMKEFDVEIEMPGRNSPPEQKDTIRVTGLPSNVDDACDKLLGIAADIIDRMIEKGELDPRQLESKSPKDESNKKKISGGFAVRDAPWNSQENFPTLGNDSGASVDAANVSWGSGRKLQMK